MKPLIDYLPEEIIHDSLLSRLAYAHDASLYRLVPRAVLKPRNEAEIISLLSYCRDTGQSVTFRTGGTSLSGQSVTSGLLAEVSHNWMDFTIGEGGRTIRLQPGLVGDLVNQYLKPFQRRIGPDPASIKAARIGGIVNNNASGMCCGTAQNSYHTLESIRFILANGHCYDTGNPEDFPRFTAREKALAQGIQTSKQKISDSPELTRKIRKKYRLKNTLGYSMNAFLDFDHPLNIFAHLLIGSEGTLAFVSEVTLRTVPDPPEKLTGLALFPDLRKACAVLPTLVETGANAVELMDYSSLTTAKYLQNPPYAVADLAPDSAALLIEYQGETNQVLLDQIDPVTEAIAGSNGNIVGGFQANDHRRAALWRIRKGLYPTVGSLRKKGTSVITEDIAYPLPDLPEVIDHLHELFKIWHFEDAVVFGHAKDGNLHFVTSIDLDSTEGVTNYAGLMDGLVELTTVKYPGSLKAEHGTGRNMAPFIEAEWGGELYSMMWALKQSADPLNILNPGVLLNRDKNIHLKNLKPIPPVNEVVDQCVECGFCEPVCPSRALTTTPRQRIVVAREINLSKDTEERKALQNDFDYAGIDTCAVDGLCESACPVNIDTGAFIKLKRRERTKILGRGIAWLGAHYFGLLQRGISSVNRLLQWKATVFGRDTMESFFRELNRITRGRIPSWSAGLVPLKKKQFSHPGTKPQWVYYPSCLSRNFAPEGTHESLMAILMEITELVGVEIRIPDVDGTCCGTPFSSKGYPEASREILTRTIELLYSESNQGKLPIIVDTSPCTWKFIHGNHELDSAALKKWEQLTFIDLAPFLNTLIRPANHPPLHRSVAIHPTCSTQKMNLVEEVLECARKCADQVILPVETGCCGYAGDRGLLFPELTAAATHREALNIANGPQLQQGISTSRTCEEGLKNATGIAYVSLALLVRDYLKQSESTHLSSG